MTEEYYTEQRAKLVKEFRFLRSTHCPLAAKARVRKIADLDYEYKGIDREITLEKFNYYKINNL